jgi:hypothetical protein
MLLVIGWVAMGLKLSGKFPEIFHGKLSSGIWGILLKFFKNVSL